MKEIDIHYGHPTVDVAMESLIFHIKSEKKLNSKVVGIIVGYGSSGGTHKIKNEALNKLLEFKASNYIKDFILGNELDIFNSKYQSFKYKDLVRSEIDKHNPGIIYVIL